MKKVMPVVNHVQKSDGSGHSFLEFSHIVSIVPTSKKMLTLGALRRLLGVYFEDYFKSKIEISVYCGIQVL